MRPEEPYSPTSDRKLSLAEHPRSLRAICSLIESLSWRTDSLRSLFSVVAPPSKCSRKVLAGGFWGTLVSTSKDTSKYTYSCNQKTREHNYELKPKHVCMLIHTYVCIHIHRYHTHTHTHIYTQLLHIVDSRPLPKEYLHGFPLLSCFFDGSSRQLGNLEHCC